MRTPRILTLSALALALSLSHPAQAANDSDLAQIREQIKQMKDAYEKRIAALENRLAQAESTASKAETVADKAEASASQAQAAAQQASQRPASANSFNPELSLILVGNYTNLSQDPDQRRLQGFMPSNGELLPEARSFNLGESELVIAGNINHLFRGALVLAIAPDNTLGVEEAYFQTLGLGNGFNLKAGRFFSSVGYLNDIHPHAWDFSNAPLPYQAFFGYQLGMDGVQARWLAPGDTYFEVGAEVGRALSFPATDDTKNKNGLMSGAVYAHVGGDVNVANSWRAGLSYFYSKPDDRTYEDPLNGTFNSFSGTSNTWIADFVWKWAPNGDASRQNLKLQGEYFNRSEDGTLVYDVDGTALGTQSGNFDNRQSGFYAQAVYQFMPRWRIGYRYDQLFSGDPSFGHDPLTSEFPSLSDYNPKRNTLMVDWTPDEYSRFRLQYAQDKTRPEATDNQFWVQYIMSLGAHGAHKY